LLNALAGCVPKRVSTLLRWVAHTIFIPRRRRFHYARAARLKSSLRCAPSANFFDELASLDEAYFARPPVSTMGVRMPGESRHPGSRIVFPIVSN
jgi:hypothetical protein